jgi:hypothetical protein
MKTRRANMEKNMSTIRRMEHFIKEWTSLIEEKWGNLTKRDRKGNLIKRKRRKKI